MDWLVDTKTYLDSKYEIEQTRNFLQELKIDIIVGKQPKTHISSLKRAFSYVHVNNFFLYYLLYVALGVIASSVF